MTEQEFSEQLASYIHNEADEATTLTVEAHLENDPSAARLSADLRALRRDGPSDVPNATEMLAATKASALAQAGLARQGRSAFWHRGAVGLAVAAALALYVGIDVFTHHSAFAAAISKLQSAQSVRIEGTVLAPDGTYIPVRWLLQQPSKYRVEVGSPSDAIVIVGDGQRGNRRMLMSHVDGLYHGFLEFDEGPAVASLIEALQVPPLPPGNVSIAGFSRINDGDVTRYTFERERRRGTGRAVIEIDRDDRLLQRYGLSMRDGDQWVSVSDLSYEISNQPLPDSLFVRQPPSEYRQVDDDGRWWFERSLSFSRAPLFASELRTARMDGDYEFVSGEPTNGDSTWTPYPELAGGIWGFQVYRCPLTEVFRNVVWAGEARTTDPALRQRKVSLTLYYRHGMSKEERLRILGQHLGVEATFSDYIESTEERFLFAQNGPILVREGFDEVDFRRQDLENGNVRYTVSGIPLIDLARYVWWNSDDNRQRVGIWPVAPGDPEKIVNGDEAPWSQLVDADFTTDGSWAQNTAYLKKTFGLTYTVREKQVRERHVVLTQK